MSYIKFENVVKKFGDNMVLKGIDLEIERGDFVTLLGPSGCGKSTLLRCLSGLEDVSGGRIFLDGKEITYTEPSKREIGMVFQQYSLFPNMNVFDNIAFGLRMKKRPHDEIVAKVKKAVEMVGKRKDFLVAHHGCVVYAVTEIETAVSDWSIDLVNRADDTIIIGNIFHKVDTSLYL